MYHSYFLRPRKEQKYKGATMPRRRRIRRKLQSIGGKCQRREHFLTQLRNEIYRREIIVDGKEFLQHTMSDNKQQRLLNYNGQRILAQVKGPAELEGVGKMFFVSIPSLKEGNFYIHENKLTSVPACQNAPRNETNP
jgi:hypothetical protein